ncbi:MAG: 1-deoxy-D-xylulose-5-phosphate synthase, partial [Kineosporiaceae bacterium]
MVALESIDGPDDLKRLTPTELDELATQIRSFLVTQVTRTGGHLGPNLGVVELTLALHRVFDSPADPIIYDTGHQAYVHKLLTGRHDFSGLRRRGGLSGYPSRAESEHDVVENSHASTALSWADGIAKGFQLRGERNRCVVAVVGDGALTGGMAWEALNNIATGDRPVVIVVNDNERSYAPTIGGLAHHLSTLRTTQGYERFLEWGRAALQRGGAPGRLAYEALHGMKKGIKDVVAPQGLFEDLGLKYLGPVDGHDIAALEHALRRAKSFGAPVLVHAITHKGRGYAPAENDDADRFHGIGVLDPDTGRPLAVAGPTWTDVFAHEIADISDERPDVVGVTAAMLIPVGLHRFAARHPERVFDVGIAEQHAVTSAAGMAFAGLHPVVAVYATFLNRAIDQVIMDVALHRAGVTFVLDRAGVTGDDGASHNGMWDLSLLQVVPGIRVAAPRDADTLRAELREAVDVSGAPTVVRFPKGALPAAVPAVGRVGGVDLLRR